MSKWKDEEEEEGIKTERAKYEVALKKLGDAARGRELKKKKVI